MHTRLSSQWSWWPTGRAVAGQITYLRLAYAIAGRCEWKSRGEDADGAVFRGAAVRLHRMHRHRWPPMHGRDSLLVDGGQPQRRSPADARQDSADVAGSLKRTSNFVQGVCELYVLSRLGTRRRLSQRVENYYLLHRASAPTGLEIQHAWLLYNLKTTWGFIRCCCVWTRCRCDRRATAAGGDAMADWAVRRAITAMDAAICCAASRFCRPHRWTTRTTWMSAGQLRRVCTGRSGKRRSDSFQDIPMDSASSATTRVRFGGACGHGHGPGRSVVAPSALRAILPIRNSWTGPRFEQARATTSAQPTSGVQRLSPCLRVRP